MRLTCRSFCFFLGVSTFGYRVYRLQSLTIQRAFDGEFGAAGDLEKGAWGQQAISGATIQIYAANTSVSKGASTALIDSTVRRMRSAFVSVLRRSIGQLVESTAA